jgi:maltose-binding protein MalE
MKGKREGRKASFICSAIAVFGLLVTLTACSPSDTGTTTDNQPVSNDTAVVGDLDHYVATEAQVEAETGPAMDIDEEAQLQQEKTTGGAGGTVTSTDIVPLDPGITAYSEGESTPGFVPDLS